MAAIDWRKLSTDDRVIAGAGATALISMFLPWWGYSSGIYSASVSGFGSGYGWIGALLIFIAGLYLVMVRSGSNVPKFSYGPAVLVLGASAIDTLLVALRWLMLPSDSAGVAGVSVFNRGPRVGIIRTLAVGIVQVFFALRQFRGSGESVPGAVQSLSSSSGGTQSS